MCFLFRNSLLNFVLLIKALKKMKEGEDEYKDIEELLPRFCDGMSFKRNTVVIKFILIKRNVLW